MTLSWKNVYIFISSTFNDMHAERDYLVKQVFPELREWCAQRKLNLIDIDLRWGVTEQDATQNKRVVQVCLERIDACRPFFLCFLGQRRGWVPSSKDVSKDTLNQFKGLEEYLGIASVTEMEILHALISPLGVGKESEKVNYAFFYLRDPDYLAEMPDQPSQLRQIYTNESIDSLAERAVADHEVKEWREKIIPAQERPIHKYKAHWTRSGSTPELAYPLQCPSADANNIERWRAQWQKVGIRIDGIDVLSDPAQAEKAYQFNASLTSGRLTEFLSDGRLLKEIILEDLQQAISDRFPDHVLSDQPSALQRDLDQQEQFIEAACQGFIARQGDFSELDSYLQSSTRQIFAITAFAGVGKTSLLAAWLKRLKQTQDQNQMDIFYRFIGASDDSTSVNGLLHSILGEVISAPDSLPVDMPADASKLRQLWVKLIRECRGNRKVVVILDAINQLETELADLTWLPSQLPDNFRLIISFKRGDLEGETFYESLQGSGQALLGEVKPFDSLDDRQKLVKEYLSQYLKELDQIHIDHLIQLPGSANPLYLKILLSELRVFGVFSELSHKIAAFGDNPVSAFQGMLERLETDPVYSTIAPGQAVPILFCLLAHARHGLSVDELSALLIRSLLLEDTLQNRDKATQTINLFLRQVRPYLATRDGRFDFFYESFKLAVLERYSISIGSPETLTCRRKTNWHGLLASYFNDLPLWTDPELQIPNTRKTAELPFHLASSEQADAYMLCLSNFDFLCAKVSAAGAENLLEDYQLPGLTGLNLSTTQERDLNTIQRAIQLSLSNLQTNDDLLAGQLIGRLADYQGDYIYSLIHQAQAWTDRVWLRPVVTAMKKPDSPLLLSFLASDSFLMDSIVSPDGKQAVTISKDVGSDNLILKGWEMATGKRIWIRTLPNEISRGSLAIQSDGKSVVCFFQNAVGKFDLLSGRVQLFNHFPGQTDGPCFLMPDGRAAIMSFDRGLIHVVLETGRNRRLPIQLGKSMIQTMRLSPSGRYLCVALGQPRFMQGVNDINQYLIANAHDTLLLIDLEANDAVQELSQNALCDEFDFTPDQKYIITASEVGRVEIWEISSGRRTAMYDALTPQQLQSVFQMSRYSMTGSATKGRGKVRVHPSGDICTCCFGSGYLKSLDIQRRETIFEQQSMYTPEPITSLVMLNETFVLSTSIPNSIEIWNVENGQLVTRLLGEESIDALTVCQQDHHTFLHTRDRGNILRWWEITTFLTSPESKPKIFDRDSLSPVYSLSISDDGSFVAAERKMSIHVMNQKDASPVLRLPAAPPPLAAMRFLPLCKQLVTVAIDGEIKIWDIPIRTCVKSIRFPMQDAPDASVQSISVSPNGKNLVLGYKSNQLQLIDLEHGINHPISRDPLLNPADLRFVRDEALGIKRPIAFGVSALCIAPNAKTLLVYANVPDLNMNHHGGRFVPGMMVAVETKEMIDVYDLQTGMLTDRILPATLITGSDKAAKTKVFKMSTCQNTNSILISIVQKTYLPYDKIKGWVEQLVYYLIRYDIESKKATTLFTTDTAILDFAISPDDHYCLAVLEDGQAVFVSLKDRSILAAFRSDQVFKSCALSLDGKVAFLGDEGGGFYQLIIENLNES